MNIHFMQSGGGMPPFTYYQPVAINTQQPQQVASGASSSSKSDATDKGKLTDKDLMEMLGKIDGLPNDMNVVYDAMANFYKEQELGISVSSLSTTYLRALQQLKTAKFNKEQFNASFKNAQKNGSLSEIAITDTGKVVVRDIDDKITYISPEEYLKNTDKYQAFTNQDLLLMRQRDPSMAYQNGVFNFVNSAISSQQLGKMIEDFMIKLGTNEINQTGYSKTKSNQIIEGIEYLRNASQQAQSNNLGANMSLDGLYESKILTKSQAESASKALNYIYQALPENAKTLIKLKTNGTREGIWEYLKNYILGQVDNTLEFTPKLLEDGEGNKPGSKTKDGGSDKDKYSVAAQWYQGYGDKADVILNGGTSFAIATQASVLPIVNKEGQSLGQCNLQQIQQSQFGPMFDVQNASFGGNFIPNSSWNQILTDGQVYSYDMPIDLEAYQNGKIKPDLNLSKKLEQLEEYIRTNNIDRKDTQKINKLCEQFNLPLMYDENGNYNYSHWKRFAVINATALGNAFTEDQSFNEYVSEVLDENKLNGYIKEFEKSQGYGEGKFKYDKPSWWDNMLRNPQNFISTNDQMFEGTLYIPIRDNMFNALSGSGSLSNMGQNQMFNIETLEQQKDRIANYNNPGEFKL